MTPKERLRDLIDAMSYEEARLLLELLWNDGPRPLCLHEERRAAEARTCEGPWPKGEE